MAEIVNLRIARKAKARREQAAAAQAQRLVHGRTLAKRHADELDAKRAAARVDGARLTRPEDDEA